MPHPSSFKLFCNNPALATLAGLCVCTMVQASSISLSETASADVFGLAGQTLTSTNAD